MTPAHVPLITIDGPSGSGKSTLGKSLAAKFHVPFIDTGLFYRGLMVAVVWNNFDATHVEEIIDLASATDIEINTDPQADDHAWSVHVNGKNPHGEERNPEHARLLSEISSILEVRRLLLEPQRILSLNGGVAVGRDCGTIVFPSADIKIYLVASDSTRRSRRATQFEEKGMVVDSTVISAEVTGRDTIDAERTYRAEGAITVSTDDREPQAVLAEVLELCKHQGYVVPHPAGNGEHQ